jgi:hypothetical protein
MKKGSYTSRAILTDSVVAASNGALFGVLLTVQRWAFTGYIKNGGASLRQLPANILLYAAAFVGVRLGMEWMQH